MGRRFAVVSTTHAKGWEVFGRQMVETLDRHWPREVALHLYHEGFAPPTGMDRLVARDLLESCPDLAAFKRRHKDNPLATGRHPWPAPRLVNVHLSGPPRRKLRLFRKGYKWDAVRFAHKAFAILHAAEHSGADVLVWVDADSRFFADVTWAEMEGWCPEDCFVGCLRRLIHTESGFVAYNLRHPGTPVLLDAFRRMYVDDLFFREEEWHDAYLFDLCRMRAEALGHRSHDIAEGIGARAMHVLINSRLGAFMDHMKGGRKGSERSPDKDLVVKRTEAYWAS